MKMKELPRSDRLAIYANKIGAFLYAETSHVSEPDIRSELHAGLQALSHAIQMLAERDAEKAAPKAATPTK